MKQLFLSTIVVIALIFTACDEPSKKSKVNIPELCEQVMFTTPEEADAAVTKAGFVKKEEYVDEKSYYEYTLGDNMYFYVGFSNNSVIEVGGGMQDTAAIEENVLKWDTFADERNQNPPVWMGFSVNEANDQYGQYMDGYLINQVKLMINSFAQQGIIPEAYISEIMEIFGQDRAAFVATMQTLPDYLQSSYIVSDEEISIQEIMSSVMMGTEMPDIMCKQTSILYSKADEEHNVANELDYSIIYTSLEELFEEELADFAPAKRKAQAMPYKASIEKLATIINNK